MSPVQNIGAAQASAGLGNGNTLAPQTEAAIRQAVSTGEPAEKMILNLQKALEPLSDSDREQVATLLSDSNDPLSQFLFSKLGMDLSAIEQMFSGKPALTQESEPEVEVAPGDVPAPSPNANPEVVGCIMPHPLPPPLSLAGMRALAAQGDPNAVEDSKLALTVDQWNFYRTEGNPGEVAGMDPVTAQKTDEMLAALGGDRNKMISAADYAKLMKSESIGNPAPKPIDAEPNLYELARLDVLTAKAASLTQPFTIDEWNFYRTSANEELGVEAQEPLSPELTDKLLEASGQSRDTPITLQKYLELLNQARFESVPHLPFEEEDLEARRVSRQRID